VVEEAQALSMVEMEMGAMAMAIIHKVVPTDAVNHLVVHHQILYYVL
jgi:hypothetical protein